MNKFTKSFLAFGLTFFMLIQLSFAQQVYKVDIKDEIGPNAWRTVNLA